MKGLRGEGIDCSSWKGLQRCSSHFEAWKGSWVWRFLAQVQSKETRGTHSCSSRTSGVTGLVNLSWWVDGVLVTEGHMSQLDTVCQEQEWN